jgi:hypothetical protein
MGIVLAYLILAIVIFGGACALIRLFASRTYPLRQKSPPDLSAFKRDRGV